MLCFIRRDNFVHHDSFNAIENESCSVESSLTDVRGLAVGAFDLVNYSLSVVGFVPVFNVGQ